MSAPKMALDLRGTDEVPFGFVYFKDTRVGFAQGEGVFEVIGWQSTLKERMEAEIFLNRVLPGWNTKKEKKSDG